jgi:hypothetical protein
MYSTKIAHLDLPARTSVKQRQVVPIQYLLLQLHQALPGGSHWLSGIHVKLICRWTCCDLSTKLCQDADIQGILGGDAKIINYSELGNLCDIDQLLPSKNDYCFILYEDRPNRGHWTALPKHNGLYEHFDTYLRRQLGDRPWLEGAAAELVAPDDGRLQGRPHAVHVQLQLGLMPLAGDGIEHSPKLQVQEALLALGRPSISQLPLLGLVRRP